MSGTFSWRGKCRPFGPARRGMAVAGRRNHSPISIPLVRPEDQGSRPAGPVGPPAPAAPPGTAGRVSRSAAAGTTAKVCRRRVPCHGGGRLFLKSVLPRRRPRRRLEVGGDAVDFHLQARPLVV